MATTIKKLDLGDFARFPDDGNRHEIIDGAELMTPPPTPVHQQAVLTVARRFADHAEAQKLGQVFVSPIGVILGEHDAVQPDVLFIAASRSSIVRPDRIEGAPDLVVEVLSPSTADHDRREKLALYQKAGVREYWLVDPVSRTVEVRDFGSPRRTRVYAAGQVIESAVLPGLSLRVDEIFSTE